MSKSFFYFIILTLVSFGAFYYVSLEIKAFSKEIDTVASKQQYYNPKILKNKIVILSPKPNQIITNPATVKGNVLGTWFFDGEIMSKIVDSNGVVLGQGPLVAEGDWTVIKNISFGGVIPFSAPSEKGGFLVIQAQDSIGGEGSSSFEIPVQFEDSTPTVCVGDSCGECLIGSIGTNGVCVHKGNTKAL